MLRTSFLSQRHPRIDGIWRLNSLLQQRAYASAVNFTGSQAKDEADLAIYVHWPYCESKCTYCSFNKYRVPPGGQNHDRMQNALLLELDHALSPSESGKPQHKRKVNSVYFGGGTPSLARPSTIAAILELIRTKCDVRKGIEVTLEGNPTSTEASKLRDFAFAGINRMSLGMQALDNNALRFFGRDHCVSSALCAAERAISIFSHVSLDFIWGRPGQIVDEWEKELRNAASLGASHMSLYALTVERGTPLYRDVHRETVKMPTQDEAAEMFERTVSIAEEHGYHHYEVSSFAKGGLEANKSQHNLAYWRGVDYIGIGPGAHGRIYAEDGKRMRTFRILDPESWMRHCEVIGHGMRKIVQMTGKEAAEELIMLGLRMMEGVSFKILSRHNHDAIASIIDINRTDELVQGGFLEWVYGKSDEAGIDLNGKWAVGLRPTRKGLEVSDALVVEVLR